MNRITTSLLFLMLCCLSTISAYALEPVNGVYQIGSADNLLEFAQIVNAGESDAKAVLTADIDLSGKSWTPIVKVLRKWASLALSVAAALSRI